MFRTLSACFAIAVLAACNQTASTGDGADNQPTVAVTGPQLEESMALAFLDLTIFDDDLSGALEARPREVLVDFTGNVTLDDMPIRLDQWLSAIKETGGTVKATPAESSAVATRGIVGELIDVVTAAQDAYQQNKKLRPVENYNAILEYDEATGQVVNARFVHR